MSNNDTYDDDCPVLYTINIIGGKWKMLILYHLLGGCLRYNQLKRQLHGITNIMLTRGLQHLEKYDLVKRIQYSEKPLHVEYSLTEHAKKLVPAMVSIAEWGKEHMVLEKNK